MCIIIVADDGSDVGSGRCNPSSRHEGRANSHRYGQTGDPRGAVVSAERGESEGRGRINEAGIQECNGSGGCGDPRGAENP